MVAAIATASAAGALTGDAVEVIHLDWARHPLCFSLPLCALCQITETEQAVRDVDA